MAKDAQESRSYQELDRWQCRHDIHELKVKIMEDLVEMVGIVGIRKVLKNSGNVMMNKGWIERKEDRWS